MLLKSLSCKPRTQQLKTSSCASTTQLKKLSFEMFQKETMNYKNLGKYLLSTYMNNISLCACLCKINKNWFFTITFKLIKFNEEVS